MYVDQVNKRQAKTVRMGLNLLDVLNYKSQVTAGPCKAVAIRYGQYTQSWDQNYVDNIAACKDKTMKKCC